MSEQEEFLKACDDLDTHKNVKKCETCGELSVKGKEVRGVKGKEGVGVFVCQKCLEKKE